MNSMDNFRERFEALEQRTEQLQQHTRVVERRLRWWRGIACGLLIVSLMSLAPPSDAANFACVAGDVACLIDAINTANANGEANTITLAAGAYTLAAVNNTTDGPNGLPSVTGIVSMQGAGADSTILEHTSAPPPFRLVHVAETGTLTLEGMTLRKGSALDGGGAIFNRGTLLVNASRLADNFAGVGGGVANGDFQTAGGSVTLTHSTVLNNSAEFNGGGLFNSQGTMLITSSTISGNDSGHGGGGIKQNDSGTLAITASTVADNSGEEGGGLSNQGTGTVIVTNSTFAKNKSGDGGGLINLGGVVILTSSTVAGNSTATSPGAQGGGGIRNYAGTVIVQDTVLAGNNSPFATEPDCAGPLISLGHNLLGEPSGCNVALFPTDLTGDPGLGTFRDNGTPGNGHFPLQRGSPAIDAGNDASCPPTDQLGRRRVNIRKVGTSLCDIGAIEFHPRRKDPAEESD